MEFVYEQPVNTIQLCCVIKHKSALLAILVPCLSLLEISLALLSLCEAAAPVGHASERRTQRPAPTPAHPAAGATVMSAKVAFAEFRGLL